MAFRLLNSALNGITVGTLAVGIGMLTIVSVIGIGILQVSLNMLKNLTT